MGAFRMRPAEGASTAPSFICWLMTSRSLCIASSVRSATSSAVLVVSTWTWVLTPRFCNSIARS